MTYATAEADYFDKRGLTRHAGAWSLWALGVAAVISGDFSGWNLGIGEAGWGGMLLATVVIGLMYLLMIYSIAEMSAAMPHTGGAYSFARSAMGPWGGFVTGLAESIEYVITTAVVGVFAGTYADSITDDLFGLSLPLWLWVVIFYIIFVGLNSAGAEASFKFAVVIAIVSLGVLALFAVLALTSGTFSWDNLWDVGGGGFLPLGAGGVLAALPFAIWFFLGIEELPLAAEETHTPAQDIPRGSLMGMFTLLATAFVVLVLNPGVVGAEKISGSGEPILEGFRAIFPDSNIASLLALFALAGLVASFQGIMFAAGRNLYSLSRAGYYPQALSLTGSRKVPYLALVTGAAIGVLLVVLLTLVRNEPGESSYDATVAVAGELLNIAVFGAVIAYVLQMVSFVMLRRKFPNAERPYRSPVGVGGAVVAAVIAAGTLVILPFNPDYRAVVLGVAAFFAVGLAYFAIRGRHHLVYSPEEEYATSGGLHGAHPETEGYDVTDREADAHDAP
ncbi:amino acid permease [Phycicoccus endophyticus]|uniref:amino acid permease n=1 Tax=Phycicoccus endophyticus TaxID=1690220 RepID=UPI00199F613C|nr:amino acid permease [Phycicoccus endophyticus]GGL41361.1 amino acid ABC transporter permease [Phycicoccus endophyticus]